MSRETVVRTDAGNIVVRRHTAITVHRVGFAPTPWQWADWAYAEDGRFDGRWDDPGGSRIASWLHGVTDVDDVPLDGIEFASRHGDDLTLWAIFERSRDGDVSAILAPRFDNAGLGTGDADLNRAMELLGLRWAD